MSLTLRQARFDDARQLAQLVAHQLEEQQEHDRWLATHRDARFDPLLSTRQLLANPWQLMVVAQQGDQIVAYARASLDPGPAHPRVLLRNLWGALWRRRSPVRAPRGATIADLYVMPMVRRRGVGTQLCAALVEHLRIKGVEDLALQVHPDNRAAVEFWRDAGFEGYRQTMLRRIG